MSVNTTTVVPKAMEFTQTDIEEIRKEIMILFDGRGSNKHMRIRPGLYKFRDNILIKRLPPSRAKDEFENQLRVWKLADPSIVRVPQPIDLFEYTRPKRRCPTSFIVMEYVANGKHQWESLSDAQIDQVATIIGYLMTFKGTAPGGLMGGAWNRGVMFGDFPDLAPESGNMEALNQWVHKLRAFRYSQPKPESVADFGEFDLVLCRMDICSGDILWPIDGGAPWLLDWKQAVYLPRLFQHFVHKMNRRDPKGFQERVLSKLEPLTEREAEFKHIFGDAVGNSIRGCIADWEASKSGASEVPVVQHIDGTEE